MKHSITQVIPTRLTVLAACILTLSLQGCGTSSSENPQTNATTNDTTPAPPLAAQAISNQAALKLLDSSVASSIAVTDSKNPIYQAQVSLVNNALPQSQEIIQIGYEDALPLALPAEASTSTQVSKILVLKRSSPTDLSYPADITLPYNKAQVKEDDILTLLSFDEASNSYLPIAINAIDTTLGVVRFKAAHFAKYVLVATSPNSVLTSQDSGFKASVDGFFIRKTSAIVSSYAMASYAVWHYGQKASTGQNLVDLYKEGDLNIEDDDVIARELVGRLGIHTTSTLLETVYSEGVAQFNSTTLAQKILNGLKLSKKPQIVLIGSEQEFKKAIVIYAYDAILGRFLSYDPDFPKEETFLPYTVVAGFGAYSKDLNASITRYVLDDSQRSYSNDYLASMKRGADSGWLSEAPVEQQANTAIAAMSRSVVAAVATPITPVVSKINSKFYPKIHITQPLVNAKNPLLYDASSEDNVVVEGTVDPDLSSNLPRAVHVYLDGVSYNNCKGTQNWYIGTNNRCYLTIPVDATNRFKFTIDRLPNATGTTVELLVSHANTVPDSITGYAPSREQATSFKAFKIKVPGLDFFQNIGFEDGVIAPWFSERKLWGRGWDSSSVIKPSDKSDIVTTGFDPIATDLNKVLFGKYALRINNQDSGYHISRVVQETVVPQTSNPVIRFNWAAVLEDPNHPASQQPYVDVTVIDMDEQDTNKRVLFNKHFYSNDPSYPTTWRVYGGWKSIPWQSVEIAVKDRIGHRIQLQVEAADCAQGAHGGYAYLDAE